MTINDEVLMAYADGELDAAAHAEVEAALAGEPGLRARLEAEQRLRTLLTAHFGPVVEEPVPERLSALLDSKVVNLAAARARRRRPLWQNAAALAAALVLGFGVGRGLPQGGPVTVKDGRMIARGALAEALDDQLASGQAPDAAIRIGISFVSADDRWCRSFERADLSGIACRRVEGWQLVAMAPGSAPQRGGYRQAGASATLLLEAAEQMMAGYPLDAEAERRARDRGWPEN